MSIFAQFLKNPKNIGAISASSKKLTEHIIKNAEIKDVKSIVELGPGTGVFTKEIIANKSNQTIFFCIEINETFVKELKKRFEKFENVKIYNDSALNMKTYLEKNNLKHCDRIISGLPWASFGKKQQEKLIKTIAECLQQDGIFVTFAYVHGMILPSARYFRKLLYKHFKKVKCSKIVWNNIPPAFVYIAEK
ncbi:methyltransferase domain-containing protein [Candidatus Woesearchaeota archaeon]|nr:methyltransferase domain-containing protein [Candidatus Woesearchaeota archaeon]